MEIKRIGSQPSVKGPSEWFIGTVRIDPLFQAPDPALVQGASVTFEPGARTAWHTHPLGQTLIVTAGCGRARRWGGPIEEIRPGDVVWFSPGEKHWHGAAPATAIGTALEAELCEEIEHPKDNLDGAGQLTVGIDGAFVKLRRDKPQGRTHFEILTGRIERERGVGAAFAIVRDLDGRAKQKVQAVLRRAGRTSDTTITVLSDGEDGLRGVESSFGRKCEHRLDWFHVSRRIEKLRKHLLYLPESPVYGWRVAFHSRNLTRIKWQLWNDGIEMADWGMKIFRAGLAEDAWGSPKSLERFRHVERQLDELRSYLFANENAVRGCAKAFRERKRVSTAHVESTLNQLVNWRSCKKQQITWTRAGAQALLHVKTSIINGTLSQHLATGGHRLKAA
jgi:quercetin dioxygenase-like cupin family protein